VLWGQFLAMLKEDGVELASVRTRLFLTMASASAPRPSHDGTVIGLLWGAVDFGDETERVPKRKIRQIANQLKLPFERYIKPDW